MATQRASWFVIGGNAVVFQAGWLLCTYFSTSLWIVVATVGASLIVNHALSAISRAELLLITIVTSLGCFMDLALGLIGVFQFGGNTLLPIWLVGLWVIFATLPARSLHWMAPYKWLASLCGFFAAPISYWFGSQITGVTFGFSTSLSLLVIAICWALLFPFALWLTQSILREEMHRVIQPA